MLHLERVMILKGAFYLVANCEISEGVTAILGPSGGGKSSLLAAIAGFQPLADGSVALNGLDLNPLAPGERPISILFQDNNLFPHLSLAQNVGLALRPDLRLTDAQYQNVQQALADVGLVGLESRKPAEVSGGQQSRAALARVLLADHPIVLLDEPFAALGPGLKSEMLALVKSRLDSAGRHILMVTHDPEDARAVADQVCLLSDNKLLPPQATETIFANPPAALRAYLGKM